MRCARIGYYSFNGRLCICFKQPIGQATKNDHLFDADKRWLVVKLRDLVFVKKSSGDDDWLRFATNPTAP
jgi:hypothetical protein